MKIIYLPNLVIKIGNPKKTYAARKLHTDSLLLTENSELRRRLYSNTEANSCNRDTY